MTEADAGLPIAPPQPPAAPSRVPVIRYDGAFVGPMLPPSAVAPPPGFEPVTDAVLAIPLGTRKLVGQALDLLTRPDAGLRSASFYIGFLVLVTVAPAVILLGLAVALDEPLFDPYAESSLNGPILAAAFVAFAGYLAASVEARSVAIAVIGGRAEGRPLRPRESIAVARRRFWTMLGATLVVGFVTTLVSSIIQVPLSLAFLGKDAIVFGISLVVGTVLGAPFAYVGSGIILGEVGVFEAIQRSIGLARARKRLALVVAMFSILSQFIVLFGVSIGGDVVLRAVDGAGIVDAFPPALVIPLGAALVFAFGTLLFLVESITAAPAVYAFAALTHYTHGLETGRTGPVAGRSLWSPWFTPGLGLVAGIGLLAVLVGIAGLPNIAG